MSDIGYWEAKIGCGFGILLIFLWLSSILVAVLLCHGGGG